MPRDMAQPDPLRADFQYEAADPQPLTPEQIERAMIVVLEEASDERRLAVRLVAVVHQVPAPEVAAWPADKLAEAFQRACDAVNAWADQSAADLETRLPEKAKKKGKKARTDGGKRLRNLTARAVAEREREIEAQWRRKWEGPEQ